MTYTKSGEPICDSCGAVYGGTIIQAAAWGWGHWEGQTEGGSQVEHIICKNCRTIGHKRAIPKIQGFEDQPMF